MFFILQVAFLIIYTPHPRERVFSVYGLLLSFFSAPFLTIISATFWTGLVSNAFSICAPLAKWQIQFRSVPHWHGDKFNFDLCPTGMVTISTLIIAPLLLCQIPDLSPNYFGVKTKFQSEPGLHSVRGPPSTFPSSRGRTYTVHTDAHAHTLAHRPHTQVHMHTHTITHTHTHTHNYDLGP